MILIVEDQPAKLRVIERVLLGCTLGVDVENVSTLEAALEVLEDEAHILVITDWTFPVRSTRPATERAGASVVEHACERSIPVAVVTGSAVRDVAEPTPWIVFGADGWREELQGFVRAHLGDACDGHVRDNQNLCHLCGVELDT